MLYENGEAMNIPRAQQHKPDLLLPCSLALACLLHIAQLVFHLHVQSDHHVKAPRVTQVISLFTLLNIYSNHCTEHRHALRVPQGNSGQPA